MSLPSAPWHPHMKSDSMLKRLPCCAIKIGKSREAQSLLLDVRGFCYQLPSKCLIQHFREKGPKDMVKLLIHIIRIAQTGPLPCPAMPGQKVPPLQTSVTYYLASDDACTSFFYDLSKVASMQCTGSLDTIGAETTWTLHLTADKELQESLGGFPRCQVPPLSRLIWRGSIRRLHVGELHDDSIRRKRLHFCWWHVNNHFEMVALQFARLIRLQRRPHALKQSCAIQIKYVVNSHGLGP